MKVFLVTAHITMADVNGMNPTPALGSSYQLMCLHVISHSMRAAS